MWRLCLEDDQQNRTVVNLVRQSYTIGRSEDNAIRLTERNISRHHAILERLPPEEKRKKDAPQWRLKDLDSYTGCFINEQNVKSEQLVDHGDRLRLGDYAITLVDEARQDETVSHSRRAIEADANSPEVSDRLVIVEGPNVGASFPLDKSRLLIGRGEECDIALGDTSVSRVHADIERADDGSYRINDQNSSNGLRVNGVEAPTMTLDIGDVVELGDVFLKFVPKGVSFDPAMTFVPASSPGGGAHPSGGRKTSSRLSRLPYAVLGVLVLGLVFVLYGMDRSDPEVVAKEPTPGEAILDEARRLFAKGQLKAAHSQLDNIPSGSRLRKSDDFRRIGAAWADELFAEAELGSDEQARPLLTRIARSDSVDLLRRRRAAQLLQRLAEPDVELNDLPHARIPDAGRDAGEPNKPRPQDATPPVTRPALQHQPPPTTPKPVAPPRAEQPPVKSPSTPPIANSAAPKAPPASPVAPATPPRVATSAAPVPRPIPFNTQPAAGTVEPAPPKVPPPLPGTSAPQKTPAASTAASEPKPADN